MSIPAETPAAVTISPSSTKRSSGAELDRRVEPPAARRTRSSRSSRAAFRSSPAAARTRAPVQTLVTSAPALRLRTDPVECRLVAGEVPRSRPPGTRRTSDRRRCLPRVVGEHAKPLRARDGWSSGRDREDLDPVVRPLRAQAASTSHGPAQSSSSAPSKRKIPIRVRRRAPRRPRGVDRGSRLWSSPRSSSRGSAASDSSANTRSKSAVDAVPHRAAGAALAPGLRDQTALEQRRDGRIGRNASDPGDLRTRDRAEVGDDRKRSRAPPARARARPDGRTGARTPRRPHSRRGTRSPRRRARARSRCVPRDSAHRGARGPSRRVRRRRRSPRRSRRP